MASLLDWLSKPFTPHEKDFNPEGAGYDYASAEECGLGPDEDGHWPSRCPKTGQLLKGKQHNTWRLLEEGEEEMGYTIFKGDDGKYYSEKQEE